MACTSPMKQFGLLAILVLFLLSPSVRADTDIDLKKLDPAWHQLEQRTRQFMGKADQRKLVDMAYAHVAADACPEIRINATAYGEGFTAIAADHPKDGIEQRTFENEMMTYFGVYTGLILAESFLNHESFCKGALHLKDLKSGPSRFWLNTTTRP